MSKNKRQLQFYKNIAEYFDNSKEMWNYFSLLATAEYNYSKKQASKHGRKIEKFMKKLAKKQISRTALLYYIENFTK